MERPTRDEWTTVRDLCYEIMAKEQDPLARAVAHSVILSSHFWEGDYEKVVAAEDELLEHHGKREAQLSDVSYRRILITAELNACESLSRLRRFPEALGRCDYAIELLEGEPFLPEAEYDRLTNHMYFLRCLTLAQTGPRQELASAAEEFLSRFPTSPHRARIEGLMHR